MWYRNAHKPFTRESFKEKFLKIPIINRRKLRFIRRGTLVGFANGLLKGILPGETHENTPGYLTFVLVAKDHRGKGMAQPFIKG